jgi:hypothetical protein
MSYPTQSRHSICFSPDFGWFDGASGTDGSALTQVFAAMKLVFHRRSRESIGDGRSAQRRGIIAEVTSDGKSPWKGFFLANAVAGNVATFLGTRSLISIYLTLMLLLWANAALWTHVANSIAWRELNNSEHRTMIENVRGNRTDTDTPLVKYEQMESINPRSHLNPRHAARFLPAAEGNHRYTVFYNVFVHPDDKSTANAGYDIIHEQLAQVASSFAASQSERLMVFYNNIGRFDEGFTDWMQSICGDLNLTCSHLNYFAQAHEGKESHLLFSSDCFLC